MIAMAPMIAVAWMFTSGAENCASRRSSSPPPMTTTAVKSAGTTQAPLREKPLMTAMAEPDAGFAPDRSAAPAGGLAGTAAGTRRGARRRVRRYRLVRQVTEDRLELGVGLGLVNGVQALIEFGHAQPALPGRLTQDLRRSLSVLVRGAPARRVLVRRGLAHAQSLGPPGALGEQGEAGADRGADAVAGRRGSLAVGRDLAVGGGALAH